MNPVLTISKATKEQVAYSCLHFHYAKCLTNRSYAHSIYAAGVWCGCIIYGPGTGTNIKIPGLCMGEWLELNRVALNGKQGTTSRALMLSIRKLKKEVPILKCLLSFADCGVGHKGIIYQATNWLYFGNNYGDAQFMYKGRPTHPNYFRDKYNTRSISKLRSMGIDVVKLPNYGKHKYLLPLTKKMKAVLTPLSKEYPK